ncbi:MAG: tetratricopeptide repeat protein [Coprococcus sp.]|nr:tetratricopeptide repeat protein [Coprococcus sp.]
MEREKNRKEMSRIFILLAALSFQLLPDLFKAIVFKILGRSLKPWMIGICIGLGIALGMALLMAAVLFSFREENRKNQGAGIRFCQGMARTGCFYLIYALLMETAFPLLAEKCSGRTTLLIITAGVAAVLFLILKGYSFYAWIEGCRACRYVHPLREFLKHPLYALGITLVLGLAEGAPDLLALGKARIPVLQEYLSWPFIIPFAGGLLQALLLLLVFGMIISMTRKKPGETMEHKENAPGVQPVLLAVFAVCAAALLIGHCVAALPDPVDTICEEIEEEIQSAGRRMAKGDVEGCLEDLKKARSIVEIWSTVLGMEQEETEEDMLERYPDSTLAEYLYCFDTKDPSLLEESMRIAGASPEYAVVLLDLYAEMGKLSKEQRAYQSDLISLCLSKGVYENYFVVPGDVAAKREKLKTAFGKYEGLAEQTELMDQAADILREGSVTREMVDDALSLAEKYPKNWIAQYIAAVTGSNLTYDHAGHYEATVRAAGEYERLYREEEELSEEDLCLLELKTASMMVNCYGYEEAVPYLEKAIEEGGLKDAFEMASHCYMELGEYEECYDLCLQVQKDDPDLVEARYYAAESALKSGDVKNALEQMQALARLAKKHSEDSDFSADVSLYTLLQMISFNDSSEYTGYQYAVYKDFTEEERKMIDKEAFFANYLDAVYYCFGSNENGHLDTALSLIEKVLDENENLPEAWYLKGAILFGKDLYKEAAQAFQKSLALLEDSPTVWYALANAYDGMEEYEAAYEACKRTMALLPEQDHGSDWYGVSFHCGNLMRALEGKVKGEN